VIPDPRERPWLPVEEAGLLFGLGRTKAYEEARRYVESAGVAGIPTIAFGRTLRCPTAKVLELLGHPAPAEGPHLRPIEGGRRR
jgi:hypothetical protein